MIDVYRQQLYWVLHLTVPERSCKIQLKLDLYNALKAASAEVLDYAKTLQLINGPSQNEWIGINIVCQRTVSRDVMLILRNVFGAFQPCAI